VRAHPTHPLPTGLVYRAERRLLAPARCEMRRVARVHVLFQSTLCWLLKRAGKGFYGDVFLSKAFGLGGEQAGDAGSLVLVKSLLSHHDVYQAEFSRELDLFSRVSHQHVVRLLGVCRDVEPLLLVTDYCEWVSESGIYAPPQTSITRTPDDTYISVICICSKLW